MLESPLNKVASSSGLQLHLKETPTQVLHYEICKIFKNTYFEEHLLTTASYNTTDHSKSTYQILRSIHGSVSKLKNLSDVQWILEVLLK